MLWFVRRGMSVFVADDDDEIEVDSWLRPLTTDERADYAFACSKYWPEDLTPFVLWRSSVRERKTNNPIHRNKHGSTVDHDVGTITREEYLAR